MELVMKIRIFLIVMLSILPITYVVAFTGPPSIYYSQYFNRGDQLKKSYKDVHGESYENYSKRIREEVERKSIQESDKKINIQEDN